MSEVRKMPENEPCLLCSETKEPKLGDIFDRPELINMIHNVSGISLARDKSLPESVCCNCIMRVNCCLEFQRCIIRNMLNHRIRYYYNIGDRAKVAKYQHECKKFQTKCMKLPSGISESFFHDSSLNRLLRSKSEKLPASGTIVNNGTAGLIISDVRTEELPQEPDSTGDEIDESESVSSAFTREDVPFDPNTTGGLLEPMFQTSESALDTESGGNIDVQNAARSARRKHNENSSIQCQQCNKIYRKANALRKHMRTHQIHLEHRKSINEKLKFKCTVCFQEFESQNVLRKHSIIHEPKIICKVCGESFRLQYDYSWHKTCCEAKHNSNNTNASQRRTRSQGRSSRGRYNGNSSHTNSSYNDRIEMVKLWTKDLEIGEKPDPKVLAHADVGEDDCASIISDVSSFTRISGLSSGSESTSNSSLTISACEGSSTDSSLWVHEQKRRKLHKAGKRKAKQRGKEYFACSFRHICSFGSTSFHKIMKHEVATHNVMLLHGCTECNKWFTSKEYLIRHKKRHRPLFHLCISCHYKFEDKYELEHHTLLHTEKSFNCNYCYMSFLKRAEIERHVRREHSNEPLVNKTSAIEIIYGAPAPKRLKEFNGYKCKELIQNFSTSTMSPNNTTSSFNGHIVLRREAEYKIKENKRLYQTRLANQWENYSTGSSCSSKSSGRSSRNKTPTKLVRESTTTRYPNNNYREIKNKLMNDNNQKRINSRIEPEFDTRSNASSISDGTDSLASYPSLYTSCESLDTIEPSIRSEISTPVFDGNQSPSYTNEDSLPESMLTNYSLTDSEMQLDSQSLPENNNISPSEDLPDKYIPPYDLLFEKYLTDDEEV